MNVVRSIVGLLIVVLMANTLLAQQPPCVPVPALPISYLGTISGCSSAPGANPTCLAGETIQFKFGDGVVSCCPATYVWQFENGPISGGTATINHQFVAAGNYTVTLSVYACPDPVVVTKAVPVAAATTVPTFGVIASLVLLAAIAAVALHRLH